MEVPHQARPPAVHPEDRDDVEESPLSLVGWLPAVRLVVNCKNAVSSYELARSVAVTQKSAWFMGHRIRAALHTGSFAKLAGEVEVDETFVGGKGRNMHRAQRRRGITGTGGADKTAVLACCRAAERSGRWSSRTAAGRPCSAALVREHVAARSALFSGELVDQCGRTRGACGLFKRTML